MSAPGRAISAEKLDELLLGLDAPAAAVMPPAPAPASEDTWKQLLGRAAAALYFDRGIYQETLTAPSAGPSPAFEEFVQHADVQPLPGNAELYRIETESLPQHLLQWLREAPDARHALSNQLAEHWHAAQAARGSDPAFELPHLLTTNPVEAKRRLDEMVATDLGRDRLDLDRAEFTLTLLAPYESLAEEPAASALREARGRLAVRKFFAADYFKSSRYLDRPRLHQALQDFLSGGPEHWILPVFAAGGAGKTMFLRHHLAREWIPSGALVAKVDFDHLYFHHLARMPWLILLPLARQFELQLGQSQFLRFHEEPVQQWERFLRRGELAGVQNLSLPEAAELESIGRSLTADFIAALPPDRPLVVVLDTTEEPYLHGQQPFLGLLEVLARVQAARPQLKLVLSGRYHLFGLRQPDLVPRVPQLAERFGSSCAPPLEIGGFDRTETEMLLSRTWGLKSLQPGVIDAVFEKCTEAPARSEAPHGAVPFDVALWARDLRQDPAQSAEDIRKKPGSGLHYLLERVLKRIPSEHGDVRWLVRYAVVPRRLTKPYLAEVLLGPLQRERSRPRHDDANAAFRQLAPHEAEIFRMGANTRAADDLWDDLRRYASGPEEGWLNPESMQESSELAALRFHERVLEPMREELEKYPIWQQLQRRSRIYFEGRAKQHRLGSNEWLEEMEEAVFHAFRESAKAGEALWRRLGRQLKLRDRAARARLARVVLGDAGFDRQGETAIPLLDRAGRRRVSVDVATAAAESMLRSAAWDLAEAEEVGSRVEAAAKLREATERWERLAPKAEETPLRKALYGVFFLEGTVEFDQRVFERLGPTEAKSEDADLVRLVRARLFEKLGRRDEALAAYRIFRDAAQRAGPAIALPARMLTVRALRRLQAPAIETAAALKGLLRVKSLSDDERWEVTYEAAALHGSMFQPKQALALLSLCLGEDDRPKARLLEIRLHLDQGRLTTALKKAKALTALKKGGDMAVAAEANRLACLAQNRLRNFTEGFTHYERAVQWARDASADDLAALHLQMVEVQLEEKGALKDAGDLLSARARQYVLEADDLAVGCEYDRLRYRLQVRLDGTAPTEVRENFTQATRHWQSTAATPVHRAEAVASLVGEGLAPIAQLVTVLQEVQPASARLRPLARLRRAATGSRNDLPGVVQALFDGAFEPSHKIPAGPSPGVLWQAEFYRVWGAIEAASQLVRDFARAARQQRNLYLLREALRLAERLGLDLEIKPPRGEAAEANLAATIRAERLLRQLHASASGQNARAVKEADKLLKPDQVKFMAQTDLYPRLLEAVAKVDGGRNPLNISLSLRLASQRWLELGDRRAAETVVRGGLQAQQAQQAQGQQSQQSEAPTSKENDDWRKNDLPSIWLRELPDGIHLYSDWTHRGKVGIPTDWLKPSLAGLHNTLVQAEAPTLGVVRTVLDAVVNHVTLKRKTTPPWIRLQDSTSLAALPWESGLEVPQRLCRFHPPQHQQSFVLQWMESALSRLSQSWDLQREIAPSGHLGPSTSQLLIEVFDRLGISRPNSLGETLQNLRNALRRNVGGPISLPGSIYLGPTKGEFRRERDGHFQMDAFAREGLDVRSSSQALLHEVFLNPCSLLWFDCALTEGRSTETEMWWEDGTLGVGLLAEALKVMPSHVYGRPVVMLDVPISRDNESENKRALLRRNDFASRLFATGLVSAVVAAVNHPWSTTGQVGRAQHLARLAAENASVGEVVEMLDRHIPSHLYATALWAEHPELPFLP